jgi:hypothetical protein
MVEVVVDLAVLTPIDPEEVVEVLAVLEVLPVPLRQ